MKLLLGIFLLLMVIGIFAAGYRLGQSAWQGASLQADFLSAKHQILELQRRLADTSLGRDVDRAAVTELRENIKRMRDHQAEIEEEVRFYRGLMAPSEVQQGLRIEKLDLETGDSPNQVRYHILLTQIVDNHKWLKGQVQMDVVGQSGDRQQVLPLTELSTVEEYPLKFRFRYYQHLRGVLVIPVGFDPIRLVVTAQSVGGHAKRLQSNFPWHVEDG